MSTELLVQDASRQLISHVTAAREIYGSAITIEGLRLVVRGINVHGWIFGFPDCVPAESVAPSYQLSEEELGLAIQKTLDQVGMPASR